MSSTRLLCWVLVAVVLPSCKQPGGERAERKAPAPPRKTTRTDAAASVPARADAMGAAVAPVIKLGAEAITCKEHNPWSWVEVDVTVSNPSKTQSVKVAWDQLFALAPKWMGKPIWSGMWRPPTLGPEATHRERVAWGFPATGRHARPTSITVVYRPDGINDAWRRVLPVRVLPTTGVTFELKGPARAQKAPPQVPDRTVRWDVQVAAIATNSTKAPIVYIPRYRASVLAPGLAAGNGTMGKMTRLDPGETVSGTISLTFFGDMPPPRRLSITHVASGTPGLAVDVTP